MCLFHGGSNALVVLIYFDIICHHLDWGVTVICVCKLCSRCSSKIQKRKSKKHHDCSVTRSAIITVSINNNVHTLTNSHLGAVYEEQKQFDFPFFRFVFSWTQFHQNIYLKYNKFCPRHDHLKPIRTRWQLLIACIIFNFVRLPTPTQESEVSKKGTCRVRQQNVCERNQKGLIVKTKGQNTLPSLQMKPLSG